MDGNKESFPVPNEYECEEGEMIIEPSKDAVKVVGAIVGVVAIVAIACFIGVLTV